MQNQQKFFSTNRLSKTIFFVFITFTLLFSSIAEATGNELFLHHAKRCHDYMIDNDFYYSPGVNIPLDREGNRRTDCSSYVSWIIYEYTNKEFDMSRDSAWFRKISKAILKGNTDAIPDFAEKWEVFNNPEDFRPGDILCYNGHVHIYAGVDSEGKRLVLNAGSQEALDEYLSTISERYFKKAIAAIRIW